MTNDIGTGIGEAFIGVDLSQDSDIDMKHLSDLVARLRREGHAISVVPREGRVAIEPAPSDDIQFVLDSNWVAVEMILATLK